MALRQIEIVASKELLGRIEAVFERHATLDSWHRELADGRLQVQVIVETKATEALLDDLEDFPNIDEKFRLLLRRVEATIPPLEVEEEKPQSEEPAPKVPDRISRQELYADIAGGADANRYFYLNVIIASIVATIGLAKSDTAVIIAAMVIAPLLGPNMALALATTLGDKKLARQSLLTNGKGLSVALGIGFLLSPILHYSDRFDVLTSSSILARTTIDIPAVILAMAAGCAGALAYTRNVAGNLVGVMVAVALLPPALCSVLLATHGDMNGAWKSFLLFIANVAGANLAAVSTFLLSGIQPRSWWEADRAKRAAKRAILAWVLVVCLLAWAIFTGSN